MCWLGQMWMRDVVRLQSPGSELLHRTFVKLGVVFSGTLWADFVEEAGIVFFLLGIFAGHAHAESSNRLATIIPGAVRTFKSLSSSGGLFSANQARQGPILQALSASLLRIVRGPAWFRYLGFLLVLSGIVLLEPGECLLNVLRSRMDIARGDADVAMAGNLLDGKCIGIGFGQPGQGSVTQVVEAETTVQLDLLNEPVVLRASGTVVQRAV